MKKQFGRIRKGDEVIVTTGRSRGKKGKVESIVGEKVFVGGVNLYKKHQKPDMQNPNGGIIEKPAPLHVSNVALVDPKSGKATRIGCHIEDGKKVRFAKASQSVL